MFKKNRCTFSLSLISISLFIAVHTTALDDTLDLQLNLVIPEGNQGFLMGNMPVH